MCHDECECQMGGSPASSPLVFKSWTEKINAMRFSANTKATSRASEQRGFSLIELLIVVAIILIIAAIAIPNMLKSRMAANQSSAVANLRTITSASVSYWVTYSNGYPPSLSALGGVSGQPATCTASILVDEVLAAPPYQRSGFQFGYTGEDGNVTSPPPGCPAGFQGYLVTATPISLGITGNMSYCTDESGILHYDTTGATSPSEDACDALPTIQ